MIGKIKNTWLRRLALVAATPFIFVILLLAVIAQFALNLYEGARSVIRDSVWAMQEAKTDFAACWARRDEQEET